MDLSTLKTWPINPAVFYKQIYVKDWYEKRLFYSRKKANGYWQNPHRCETSYNLAKPFIKKFNRCIDIGCRDGEFTRWLESDFKHTYCFDVTRSRFFEWNVPVNRGTTTLFTCALSHEAGMKPKKHLVKNKADRSNVRGKHTTFSEDDIKKVKNVGTPDRCFTLDSFYLGKIDFMKMFLKMGTLANQDDKQALAFQERIVFATEGVIKPDDWDELPFEERKKRMDKLLKQI